MFLSLTRFFFGAVLASSAALAQMPSQLPGNAKPTDRGTSNNSLIIMGRVLVDDGSVLPNDVVIERLCGEGVNATAYADRHGDFQFQMTAPANSDNVALQALGDDGPASLADWNYCELRASAVGYTSSKFSFAGKVAGSSQVNVGTLFIHRVNAERATTATTVSAADLAIPEKARKDFGKGEDCALKGDWTSALRSFRRALDRYPQFAAAWVGLAGAQLQLGDRGSAEQSFQKALALDSRLLAAYAGLSEIAVQDRRWRDLETSTDRLLAINSESFPQFWLLNAVAKYNLGMVDRAETSVLRGLRLDTQHRYPKMEHLLGMILGIKHHYAEAADHLKNYLRLAPDAPDASAVQTQLDKFQQMAGTTVAGK
ncbi:MAG TPA: tetratricopeptide repeat protein [Terriglobales bacterium]|nr:tetratricopeptide repeat protein [Terriglobales bacterium]